MTPTDRPKLAELLAILSETFNEPVSEMRAEGYFVALEDLPISAVHEAAHLALKSCKFFPRPSELRELVVGSSTMIALLAWRDVHCEISRVGSWREPNLTPEVLDVVKTLCGSWENCVTTIGRATGHELDVWEKRFTAVVTDAYHRNRAEAFARLREPKALTS